jgi:hypothetical protein
MVLASIVLASPGRAQTPAHQHGAQVQTQPPAEQMKGQMAGDQKMADMKKMMAEKMAAKEAAADRLAALMTRMKEATGEAKVTAMADVIAALVEQRAAMEEHCAMMMKMMPQDTAKPAK